MKPCGKMLKRLSLILFMLAVSGGSLFSQAPEKRQRMPEDRLPEPRTSATITVSNPIPPAAPLPPAGERPLPLSGSTIPAAVITPNLDGVISPGEWSDALVITPAPIFGWLGAGSKIYLKNDACFLWIAADIYDGNCGSLGNGVTDNLEIWFDQNRNSQWDAPGDGIYAFPEPPLPGYNTMNGQTVGHSWPGNPAWSGTSPTGYQWSHWPWLVPGSSQLPAAVAQVRRSFPSTTPCSYRTHIEAKIDYRNSSLQMTPGIYSNMEMKLYMGNTVFGGNVTIMGEWPSTPYWFWYHYPIAAYMHSYTPSSVPSAGDVFDVVSIDADNSTSYAFPNGATDKIPVFVTGAPNPAPYTAAWSATMKGPALLATSYAFNGTVIFTSNPQSQTVALPTAGIPQGFYTLEMSVADPTVCGPAAKKESFRVLVYNSGATPCKVWPGDMDNNGTVNLADRNALQKYIYDADTDPLWLEGPIRLAAGRVMPNSSPLDIFTWEPQPGLTWSTGQGCFMDADGNGNVNNLDLAAIKFNAGRTHNASPVEGPGAELPGAYNLYQNYPNPFNPSTHIGFALPKESVVRIRIVDVLGRTVREALDGVRPAGSVTVTLDASDLASGVYFYTMTAAATDGAGSFTKTMKMAVSK